MIINGNRYVTATADDFGVVESGYYNDKGTQRQLYALRYIGEDRFVRVPSFEELLQEKGHEFVLVDGEEKKTVSVPYDRIHKDYRSMFEGTDVEGVAGGDSSIVNMESMFRNTTAASIDLTGLYTVNVRNMSSMFFGSKALMLKVNRFNTAQVTNMSEMFMGTHASVLDLRNFNTSNVSDMSHMFANTEAGRIDVSTFDTSKVTDMSFMFARSKAEELDMLNFDTTNVRDYSYMFSHSKAVELDLGSFSYEGGQKTDANGMFQYSAAKYIKLNSFSFTTRGSIQAANQDRYNNMFEGASVSELDLSASDLDAGGGIFSRKAHLRDFLTGASIEVVYVKDRGSRNRLRSNSINPDDINIEIGGEGYIEPVVRPPAALIDPGNGDIEEVIPGETTTELIEYKEIREMNREWKDGKEEVIQEGENGYRQIRTDTIVYVDGTQREVTRTIASKSATNEIIEYGTIVEEETERREEIYEHETETYNDYELNYPQERIQQRGEDGYFRQVVKVITHSDGYVEEIIDEDETERKEPATEIIAIGMIERKSTVTETEEIPFHTITNYDYELAYNDGEPHIEERGKNGSIRRTFEITVYVDDTPDLKVEHPEKRATTPFVNQSEIIGLIDRIVEEEEERVIEFDVAYEYTKDLLEGEERLKQQGENGYESRNYEVTYYITHPRTAVKREPKKEEIEEDYEYEAPVTHIIEIGAQEAVVSIEDDIISKIVRFETEYIDDPTLYEGQEIVSRQGKDGSSEEKWQIITFYDGEVQRHHVSTSVVDPINAIIRRGTKNPIVKEWEEVEEKVLPYETVYIKTNDLADGVEEIAREGLAGTITITYLVQEYYDGRVEREPIKEKRTDVVNEIVKIGTDEVIVSQEQDVTVEIIEFETEYVDDDTLYIGEQRIQTEGQNGKTEYIYIVTEFEDGEVERVLIGTSTTEAITQVILVGTKREESEKELINVENLGTKHTGGFLYLEDGDKTIRATTATKIRPIWGYL